MFKVMLTDQNEIIDLTPATELLNEETIQQKDVGKHSKLSLKEVIHLSISNAHVLFNLPFTNWVRKRM